MYADARVQRALEAEAKRSRCSYNLVAELILFKHFQDQGAIASDAVPLPPGRGCLIEQEDSSL